MISYFYWVVVIAAVMGLLGLLGRVTIKNCNPLLPVEQRAE
jgi:hypothetical protein